MNFNTIFLQFGLNPDDFEEAVIGPISTDFGYAYFADVKRIAIKCPFCGSFHTIIKDHDTTNYELTTNPSIKIKLVVKKNRYICKDCKKSFTPRLEGTFKNSKVTKQQISCMRNDFLKPLTFKQISETYNLSTTKTIQIFDNQFLYLPREKMPRILCIDEFKNNTDKNNKYACILIDFIRHKFVDILPSRRYEYLDDFFQNVDIRERTNVKIFISDMFEGYYRVRKKYFPNAIHIVDIFHVLKQLKDRLNSIRTNTMNQNKENVFEYNFMKSHWKYFLMPKYQVPYGHFTSKITGEVETNDLAVFRCLKLNAKFMNAYDIYQELLEYKDWKTKEQAEKFLQRIIYRLSISESYELQKVGETYKTWKNEIVNAFSVLDNGLYYTNGIAESLNNSIDKLLHICNGFQNFKRQRKRLMLIQNYGKRGE